VGEVSLIMGKRGRRCLTERRSDTAAVAVQNTGNDLDARPFASGNLRKQIVHCLWTTSASTLATGLDQWAYFSKRRVRFGGGWFGGARFGGARFGGARFGGARFGGAWFGGAWFDHCDDW
jgi:uncharacterized protein YjbI with pentapeptide repeats